MHFEDETVWLSQRMMADLFQKDSDTIGLHLMNIFKEEERSEGATTELFSVVQTEGKRKVTRKVKHFNLDVIISVGYRLKSKQGKQFRQWATQRLREYLVQGSTINEKRLQRQQSATFKPSPQPIAGSGIALHRCPADTQTTGWYLQGILLIDIPNCPVEILL